MKRHTGLSIFDLMLSIGIFALLIVVIATMQIAILRNNSLFTSRATIDQRSLTLLHAFATEARAAQTPYDGSTPLALTTHDTIAFYSDINGDGTIERVRYWIDDNTLKRSVIIPSGQPLAYHAETESTTSLIKNIANNPPYFVYYGSLYDGSVASQPLTQPVSPSDVRLVKLMLNILTNVASQPARSIETSAMIRSLKNK